MNPTGMSFQRVEKKYLLTPGQLKAVLPLLESRLETDARGQQSIRNVYYDTMDFALIRHSIDKPVYKEKLRLRSYGETQGDSAVYVEMKKKYKGVVYKRRVTMTLKEAELFLAKGILTMPETQVHSEVRYLCQKFHLLPAVYLSYDRVACADPSGSGLRITIDQAITARRDRLSLREPVGGLALLNHGQALMEVKAPGAFPLWLSQALSSLGIFPVAFSKVGEYYQQHLLPQSLKGGDAFYAAS